MMPLAPSDGKFGTLIVIVGSGPKASMVGRYIWYGLSDAEETGTGIRPPSAAEMASFTSEAHVTGATCEVPCAAVTTTLLSAVSFTVSTVPSAEYETGMASPSSSRSLGNPVFPSVVVNEIWYVSYAVCPHKAHARDANAGLARKRGGAH